MRLTPDGFTYIALFVALTSGLACYACFRWHYWRKRALHTEECLAITKVLRERRSKGPIKPGEVVEYKPPC